IVERGVPRAYSHATLAELVAAVVPHTVETPTIPVVEPARADSEPDAIDAEEDVEPSDAPAAASAGSRFSAAPPEGFVAGGYDTDVFDRADRPTRTAAPRSVPRDTASDPDVIRAAYRLALRQALELYTALASDAGIEAFATDVDLVFVTGAGVDA